jgi:membrane-anchored protein YejM (alkaline phosphatase superfamily)
MKESLNLTPGSERLSQLENLKGKNHLIMTFDSCRFDSAKLATMPNLSQVATLMEAQTLSHYTPAAHTAFFLGHLPTTPNSIPFFDETKMQPFRITTGPGRDLGKNCGLLLEGNNIIEGFRKKGFFVLGVGGVSQFSSGSFLREAFQWSKFTYLGPDMDEEPLKTREPNHFPLNNIDQIVTQLQNQGKWTLFINCPETHYPYDWGEGIPSEVEAIFPILKKGLNLRCHNLLPEEKSILLEQADSMHQMQVDALEAMDPKIGGLLNDLQSISRANDREVFVSVCGDHGENFGEGLDSNQKNGLFWGHMHPNTQCMNVPLWMAVI